MGFDQHVAIVDSRRQLAGKEIGQLADFFLHGRDQFFHLGDGKRLVPGRLGQQFFQRGVPAIDHQIGQRSASRKIRGSACSASDK